MSIQSKLPLVFKIVSVQTLQSSEFAHQLLQQLFASVGKLKSIWIQCYCFWFNALTCKLDWVQMLDRSLEGSLNWLSSV